MRTGWRVAQGLGGLSRLSRPSGRIAELGLGVRPIALPLLKAQAERLIAVAKRAPYGRGEETLVDTEVRRTWQIDADRIRIEGKLARDWEESGEGPESPLWRQAHELAGHMRRTWPREDWRYRQGKSRNEAAEMLAILFRLKDTTRIDAFLTHLSANGVYGKSDNEALIQAVGLLPPLRAAELIERIVAGNAAAHLSACGDPLARAAT
ncbi:MAG: hypothetical protein ACRESZ_07380 [Methylococcales bacterium]